MRDDARVAALQAASLLLGYPDADLYARLPLLEHAAGQLPAAAGEPLARMVAHLQATPPDEAERAYVDLFDLRRRCCLYLTYYAFGDTRKRGMALLRFTHAYKAAGWELVSDELPDHLAVVLEFASTADADAGRRLLLDHRAGVELLRLALVDADSPYADVLRAVCATLPPLRGDETEAVARLAAEGPPVEEVGLSPFTMPELATEGARR